MTYQLSQDSKDEVATCHPDLQTIIYTAIKYSKVDFSIIEGYRSVEDQNKYFRQGRSMIDGINKKGKHNYTPSLAFDFCPYFSGKQQWHHNPSFDYLAGTFLAIASLLLENNVIGSRVRWGGNWDNDGILLEDQNFWDRPHIEIIWQWLKYHLSS